jgi:hypothetical protein
METLIQKEAAQEYLQELKETLERNSIDVEVMSTLFGSTFYVAFFSCTRHDEVGEVRLSINQSSISISNFQKHKSCVLMTEDLQFIADTVNDYF